MFVGNMNLSDNVSNHLPLQAGATTNPDVFGIEVELEGKNITAMPHEVQVYWAQHNDGSLRKLAPGDEAIEYVSRKPFNMATQEKAVSLLFDQLNKKETKVYDSYRTSIHIHVNFGLETFRTVYNFMTLAMILDELLVSQNGDHRIGNNFCFRAKDALGQVINLISSIESGNNFFNIITNERYSSINFASLIKFGSVEFRSLECTTHKGRVMHWLGTLQQLKEKARTYKNPVEVIEQFSKLGPRAFLQSVLGPFALKYTNVKDADIMLHNGMRIAQDFAYCSAWNEPTQVDRAKQALDAKKKIVLKKQVYKEWQA